jgi:hypothetical protein
MSEWVRVARHVDERQSRPRTSGRLKMEFILMAYVQETGWDKLTPEQQKQGMAAYTAYTRSLADAGVLMVNRRLGSSGSSRTLRGSNGNTQVLDGPYSDSKGQLGGLYIIKVNDRAEAMRWAAKCPAVGHGVLEVRELPAH